MKYVILEGDAKDLDATIVDFFECETDKEALKICEDKIAAIRTMVNLDAMYSLAKITNVYRLDVTLTELPK